jgi:hypothetical protein
MVEVGEMMHKKFNVQSQAVAGVIEALLMVALVSIVISMIQLYYIPQVMEQKEAEHMDQVFNQFSSLKSMMDMQSMTQSSSPISSMITLGSRELPYFITARSYGGLTVNEQMQYRLETPNGFPIIFPPFPSGASFPPGTVPLTSIEYDADNSYFTDQSYILEGGGIIVNQPDGIPVMRANPSISAGYIGVPPNDKVKIHFELPVSMGMRAKNNSYSEGNCFIRTNYSVNNTYSYLVEKSQVGDCLKIFTKYPNAWNESLNDILEDFVNNSNIVITNVHAEPTSYIKIAPNSGVNGKDILLEINVIRIYVQIGPGWIK